VLCSSYPKLQLSTAHINIILELSTVLVASKSEIFLKNLVGGRRFHPDYMLRKQYGD
jgi:hypothetical protein